MTARAERRFLVVVVATLLSLGCIAVYSATAIQGMAVYGQSLRFLLHHVIAIIIGIGFGTACLAIPADALRRSAKWLLLISVVLLALVLWLAPEISGARRWFRMGPLSIQPSEFAQLSLIVYVSDFLARKRAVIGNLREGFLPPIMVLGVMALLVLAQPDLGTTIVMASVVMLLLMVAKARGRHISLTALLGVVALIVLIAGESYRRRRILAFLNPWQDPQGAGFQILQSYLALASGGIVGEGLGESMQKLFFLPGAHTDFIFAIIGEELGLLGTTAMLALFGLFVLCGIRMAQAADDLFKKYLITGCVALIAFEAIVHMAVDIGLLPTKGLPLPLVSYGGTAMVGNLLACALIVQASRPEPTALLPSEAT